MIAMAIRALPQPVWDAIDALGPGATIAQKIAIVEDYYAKFPKRSPLPGRWCWICRWVNFTSIKAPLLQICYDCVRHPLRGWRSRRRPGDDPELDAVDENAP